MMALQNGMAVACVGRAMSYNSNMVRVAGRDVDA